jgi:hypothetical protein
MDFAKPPEVLQPKEEQQSGSFISKYVRTFSYNVIVSITLTKIVTVVLLGSARHSCLYFHVRRR